MEIQIALAGNSADTAKYRASLVARGFNIKIQDQRVMIEGDLKTIPGDPASNDFTAVKNFYDSTDALRAVLEVELDSGENVEYSVRAKINIGSPTETTAYWFSVHSSNVDDKVELVDSLMTQLYGSAN